MFFTIYTDQSIYIHLVAISFVMTKMFKCNHVDINPYIMSVDIHINIKVLPSSPFHHSPVLRIQFFLHNYF